MRKRLSVEEYKKGILAKDKVILGKSITLVESHLASDQMLAKKLLSSLPVSSNSFRIGITGPPGAGKSTFIEAFGKTVASNGNNLAVLAIDPSSAKSHGSILGDKTRMADLSSNKNVYIRPTASGKMKGGIAAKSREAIQICEAAGHNVIILETVGVGQSEVAAADMVDFFILILSPAGGDELQGMKKGIVEMADLIVINKTDGDYILAAKKTKADYTKAVHLFPPGKPGWTTEVLSCSALTGEGIELVWEKCQHYKKQAIETGFFEENRKSQNISWLHEIIQNRLTFGFYNHPQIKKEIEKFEKLLLNTGTTPYEAADQLLDQFSNSSS